MAAALSLFHDAYQPTANDPLDRFRVIVGNSGDEPTTARAFLTSIKTSSGGPTVSSIRFPIPLRISHIRTGPDIIAQELLQPGHPGMVVEVLEKVEGSSVAYRILDAVGEFPQVNLANSYVVHLSFTGTGLAAPLSVVFTATLVSGVFKFTRTT